MKENKNEVKGNFRKRKERNGMMVIGERDCVFVFGSTREGGGGPYLKIWEWAKAKAKAKQIGGWGFRGEKGMTSPCSGTCEGEFEEFGNLHSCE